LQPCCENPNGIKTKSNRYLFIIYSFYGSRYVLLAKIVPLFDKPALNCVNKNWSHESVPRKQFISKFAAALSVHKTS